MPYRRPHRLDAKPMRLLDICLPILRDETAENVLRGAEEMRARWHKRRREGGVPEINGRAGAAVHITERGQLPAATFTARIPEDHPFYDDPQKLLDAMVDLLDLLGVKLDTSMEPEIVYDGTPWRCGFTWRQV